MVWRFIYDTEKVDILFETSDITLTTKNVFDGNTIDECFNKIDELQLYCVYPLNDTQDIIFSGGTRTISNKELFI
jgi:hypothetical protein